MKVLVLGGCGYIGSRLVPMLLTKGHEVTVVDPQWFGDGGIADNGNLKVTKADMREVSLPDSDAVIHLASMSQSGMYEKDFDLTHAINRWVPEISGRYIYASSIVAYGPCDDTKPFDVLTEESPLRPTLPYGVDKAYCDEFVRAAGGTALRIASVCGHSQNMRFDTPFNAMTREAMKLGRIRCEGGDQVRTHIALDDLCELFNVLLETPQEVITGQAFNASDEWRNMTVAANMVSDITNAKIEFLPARDTRKYMMSSEKANRILGWKPNHSHQSPIWRAIHFMKAFSLSHPQYRDFSPARMRML